MPVRTARAFEKGRGTGRMGNFADGMTGISNGESYIPSINHSFNQSILSLNQTNPRAPISPIESGINSVVVVVVGGGREKRRERWERGGKKGRP